MNNKKTIKNIRIYYTMKNKYFKLISLGLISLLMSQSAFTSVTYKDGEKYVKFGGRIQLQYYVDDPDGKSSEDKLFFRRLRPYIEGSVHKDWKGKFQWDMGKSTTEIKDAYLQYKGIEDIKISVGNANFPFSRELLTSSKKQQLVERTFVGDHNYGTPDRQAGIHVEGSNLNKTIEWKTSVAIGAIDPDNKKLDFDTVISLNSGNDWSEGPMIGARIDFFPLGHFKFSQGDFKNDDIKIGFGLSAFTWVNDNDNLTPYSIEDEHTKKLDVDKVTGLEADIAIRGLGFSVDMQYNTFDSDLVDAGITNGLYKDSSTTLENYAIEGGFMVVPEKLEIVVGYQVQDADNYARTWDRASVGVNFYIHKHDIKNQLTYRQNSNKDGVDGNDVNEIFLQTQYVF